MHKAKRKTTAGKELSIQEIENYKYQPIWKADNIQEKWNENQLRSSTKEHVM